MKSSVGVCVSLRGQMRRDWLLFHSIWITDRHIDITDRDQSLNDTYATGETAVKQEKASCWCLWEKWWWWWWGRICMSLSPSLPMIHLSGLIGNHAVAVWVCTCPEETCLVLSVPLSLQWQCNICLFVCVCNHQFWPFLSGGFSSSPFGCFLHRWQGDFRHLYELEQRVEVNLVCHALI